MSSNAAFSIHNPDSRWHHQKNIRYFGGNFVYEGRDLLPIGNKKKPTKIDKKLRHNML